MAVTGLEGVALLAARGLFGGVLAFIGLNHVLQTDGMTQYAAHEGLPAPRLSVLASGAALVLGGLSIVLGVLPLVGGLTVAGFLLVAAVTMHDFWAVPADQRQDEMTQFLKNAALAGGAIAFAAIAGQAWSLSLGVGL
jgi:putative oxidoreductase